MANKEISHVGKDGEPGMVDVSEKSISVRKAVASAKINLGFEVMKTLEAADFVTKKGPVFSTAIIAGTMAVKSTSSVIPFCHPLPIDDCKIDISKISDQQLLVSCTVKTTAKTGVEMEAIYGASVTSITVYDMCKALSPNIIIEEVKLKEKTGGKSDFIH